MEDSRRLSYIATRTRYHKKGRVNDMQLNFEFKVGNNKEYEVDGIWDSAVYAKKSAGQLSRLYYLVSWKSYPEEENIWELISAIQHLWRLVTAYHKDNPEKPTAISLPVNTAPLMAKPSTSLRPTAKRTMAPKWGRPAGSTAAPTEKCGRPVGSTTTTTKQAKKS